MRVNGSQDAVLVTRDTAVAVRKRRGISRQSSKLLPARVAKRTRQVTTAWDVRPRPRRCHPHVCAQSSTPCDCCLFTAVLWKDALVAVACGSLSYSLLPARTSAKLAQGSFHHPISLHTLAMPPSFSSPPPTVGAGVLQLSFPAPHVLFMAMNRPEVYNAMVCTCLDYDKRTGRA